MSGRRLGRVRRRIAVWGSLASSLLLESTEEGSRLRPGGEPSLAYAARHHRNHEGLRRLNWRRGEDEFRAAEETVRSWARLSAAAVETAEDLLELETGPAPPLLVVFRKDEAELIEGEARGPPGLGKAVGGAVARFAALGLPPVCHLENLLEAARYLQGVRWAAAWGRLAGRYGWKRAQAALWARLRQGVRARERCRLSITHYQASCDLSHRFFALAGSVIDEDTDHPVLGEDPQIEERARGVWRRERERD